jgi:hypothetical protein
LRKKLFNLALWISFAGMITRMLYGSVIYGRVNKTRPISVAGRKSG